MNADAPETLGCANDVAGAEPVKSGAMRRVMFSVIFTMPAVAALIVILFLVLGRARVSETVTRFLESLVYTICIGVPSAIVLTWMSFRWTARLGKLILLPQALVLITSATLGSMMAALVLQLIQVFPSSFYWLEFKGSYPFSIVISLVVGLTMTTYQTLRQQLNAATLQLRTKQVEQERAYKFLAEARLSSLESRLHPHFLFNTLNSIAALIPRDPQRAEDTVSKLASLLRFSLATHSTGLVTLAQELKFVRDYLEIETTRFGTRLRYEIEVPNELMEVKTPPMALQSLVENAVKHVVAQRIEGAQLHIEATREGELLRLEVTDDGPGFSLNAITPEHGLGNLRARLELLYADRGRLFVTRRDALTIVGLEFPAEA
jgi:two-component system, LytTR family, sensor histidine kinase AlgZ